MIAYKLFRLRTDGSLGPLFINRKQRIQIGRWMDAEDHPTKGYAHRPGWHCTATPKAPHLKKKPKCGERRVWCRVEIADFTEFERPKNQGGKWFLASQMRVKEILG